MTTQVTASAPGKLILLGEHAVVYRRPALVAAVDLRLTAALRPHGGNAVHLSVPALGVQQRTSWPEIAAYATAAAERWQTWHDAVERGEAGGFSTVRGNDPAHVLLLALGEASRYLGERTAEGRCPGLHLSLRSELPVGSGFGSSAAAALAIAAGYLALRGAAAPADDLEALALTVERRQHGLPSGVDGATVLHGGLIWAERDATGALAFTPFPADSPLLPRFTVLHSGEPAESTGEVVSGVRRAAAAEPARFEALWDEIEAAARELRELLAGGEDDPEAAVALLRRASAALEAAGVVPAAVAERIRAVEAAGGGAKISGAGSLAGPGAGSLLAVHPDPTRLDQLPALADLRRYPVRLGAPGLQVDHEPTAPPHAEGRPR